MPTATPEPQIKVRNIIEPSQEFEAVKDNALGALRSLFPIQGRVRELRLEDLRADDDKPSSAVYDQLQTKLRDGTWGIPLVGKLALVDRASGKVVDRKEVRLAQLPKLTDRLSYIVDGKELQVDKQWRLLPGVYTRVKENGELESQFNIRGGERFNLGFDPKTRKFHMELGGSRFPLFPVLRAAGVKVEDMRRAWGSEILTANATEREENTLRKFYRASAGGRERPASVEPRAYVREFLSSKMLDPETTSVTLGKGVERADGPSLLLATNSLLGVSRGERDPDDRDSLIFKQLYGTEDFIRDKIQIYARAANRRVTNNVDRLEEVDRIVYPGFFDRPIKSLFTESVVANVPTQDNPLTFLEGHTKTTILGPGGISNIQAVTDEAKAVDPSHFAFVDPIDTPLGGDRVGMSTHLALGASKGGNRVYTPVYDVKERAMRVVDPQRFYSSYVALPEGVRWVGEGPNARPEPRQKTVRALGPGNRIQEVPWSSVRYVIKNPATLFNATTNLIPFLSTNSGARMAMADKHMTQAVALKAREAPMVDVELSPGVTSSMIPGKLVNVYSPVDGKVTSVGRGEITVRDPRGKSHRVETYDYFPLNDKRAGLHSEPVVKVGDRVKKGGLLAESTFTKGDKLALGTHLRTGLIAIPGRTYEDAILISESGALKLTSDHLYKHNQPAPAENTRIGKSAFGSYYPNRFSAPQLAKLDDDGVIREGQTVNPGDPLTVSLQEQTYTSEAKMIGRLKKSLVKPYRDMSAQWDREVPGKVVRVHKQPDGSAKIFVQADEPLRVGDKLCYDERTEILTDRGWLPFSALALQDRVATLTERGHLEYQHPTRVDHFLHQGPMYHVASQQLDLLVTPEHRMYVRLRGRSDYSLIPARDLFGKKGVRYKKDARWNGNVVIPDKPVLGIGRGSRAELHPEINPVSEDEYHAQTEEWISYDGYVYCCEVPNHVLYVRRSGKSVWSGNSSLFGDKGTVVDIRPDNLMPRDKEGKPIELAVNFYGVPSRLNPGQVYAMAAGKISQKTGKPFLVRNFEPDVDYGEMVRQELKRHGVKDTEELFDPVTDASLGDVFVGPKYVIKHHHQVDRKISSRAGGPGYAYDVDRQPRRGGMQGAQSIGSLGTLALLAHGSRDILREAQTLKSDMAQQDELWRAIQLGQPIPSPKPTFAQEKFENYLNVLGVRLHKDGTRIQMIPLTDEETLKVSSGEIKRPDLTLRAHDLSPEGGGLFDPRVTGGIDGMKAAHIKLPESIPNPFFERGVLALTGLTQARLLEVLESKLGVDPKTGEMVAPKTPGALTGSRAVQHLLRGIDVKKEREAVREQLPRLHGQALDRANRRLRYLDALAQHKLSPERAYMTSVIPVLPPTMRPLTVLPSGDLVSDPLNETYKALGVVSRKMETMDPSLPERSRGRLRKELYTSLAALTGMGAGYKRVQGGETQGIMDVFTEPVSKHGWIQKRLMKARQDLSARSVIVPDPTLTMDEVGIPRRIASEIYRPFVVRELTRTGYTPLKAEEMIRKNDPTAEEALKRVMNERPVLMKRDPVLHRYGVQAFKPRLTGGYEIRVPPVITQGYGADFDGDSYLGEILIDNSSRRGYSGGQEVDMPHDTAVCCLEIIDIKDFPRIEESLVERKSGVVEFDVPAGVRVPSFRDGKMEMREVTKFSIHPDCAEWKVRTALGRELICSGDHSLAVLDPMDLSVKKCSPKYAEGACLPVFRSLSSPAAMVSLPGVPPTSKRAHPMLDTVPLDAEVGWFLGATVGDGWITRVRHRHLGARKEYSDAQSRAVCLAHGEGGHLVAQTWAKIGAKLTLRGVDTLRKIDLPEHEFGGSKKCRSSRTQITNTALGIWLEPLIGKGSQFKHLLPGFLDAPEEFRRGLFAGLMDTDGTAGWSSGGKQRDGYVKRPQFTLSYTTISRRLADEIRLLGLSLGLPSTCTVYENRGKPVFLVVFSIRPVADASWLSLIHPAKAAALARLRSGEKPNYGRNDFVPLPSWVYEDLSRHLRERGASARPHKRNTRAFSLYSTMRHARLKLTRIMASNLWSFLSGDALSDRLRQWFGIALDPGIGWDQVESAIPTGERKTMYDITVPGAWTFAAADGVILWDTMALYVPITSGAVKDARKMMPSANLLNPATGKPVYTPGNEMSLGLYRATTIDEKEATAAPKFATPEEALVAEAKKEIPAWSTVRVGGRPTTVGRIRMWSTLPEDMRTDEILYAPDHVMNAARTNLLLHDLAEKHPQEYARTVQDITDLGSRNVYEKAFTLSTDDFRADKQSRDQAFAWANAEIGKLRTKRLTPKEREERALDVWERAGKMMEDLHWKKRETDPTRLSLLPRAGVKPTVDQYKQITLAPLIMVGSGGRVIPNPVTKSYSEGLDVAGYWTQAMAARGTLLKATQEVREPGYLSKLLVNTVADTVVAAEDCGTTEGVSLPVDHPDVLDRYLARPAAGYPRNALVDNELVGRLRDAKTPSVVVRSPLKCRLPVGVCQKCAGAYSGHRPPEIGTNLGVMAGQAIGERSTQLLLKSKHTSGISERGGGAAAVSQLDRVSQLLRIPQKIPDAATLSDLPGRVETVDKDPAGGWSVRVRAPEGRETRAFHVPAHLGLAPALRPGSSISPGQPLSGGNINVHDLLRATGDIHQVQNQIASELDDIYRPQGIRRRNVEIIARGVTNLGQVLDAGDNDTVRRGDMLPLSVVDDWNARNRKARLMRAQPVLKGISYAPLDMTEDWMAKLHHERLKDTIVDAALEGHAANVAGYNPFSGLAFNPDFGIGDPTLPGSY